MISLCAHHTLVTFVLRLLTMHRLILFTFHAFASHSTDRQQNWPFEDESWHLPSAQQVFGGVDWMRVHSPTSSITTRAQIRPAPRNLNTV